MVHTSGPHLRPVSPEPESSSPAPGLAGAAEPAIPMLRAESVTVVEAPEEIDITNAGVLRAALIEAAARGSGVVVVDMMQTQFCDSTGLHVLLRAHGRAAEQGQDFRLVIAHEAVLRIFSVTGFDRVMQVFPTLDEALSHKA
jgi:anti-sigma B factor antagonist